MNLDPQTLAIEQTANDEIRIRLAVPAQLPFFADHFPGSPMLPGVLQLGWAVRLAQQQFGIEQPLQQVAQLKFQHPILPDRELWLRLRRSAAQQVSFHYDTAAQACSSGRLQFADAA